MENQETNQERLLRHIPPPPPPSPMTKPSLFCLMTTDESEAEFNAIVTRRNPTEIQTIASFMSSDPNYFTAIIGSNQNGLERTPLLFGISQEADGLFCDAISSRLVNIMTNRKTSYVAVRAMTRILNQDKTHILNQDKKIALYAHTIDNFFGITCTSHGCDSLSIVIAGAYDLEFKNRLLDMVAYNALYLSNDRYGSFVVQNVLCLDDLRTTYNIAVSLQERCVEMSFRKSGSYIVESLLMAKQEEITYMVAGELSRCEIKTFIRLATNESGNYVVNMALEVTVGTVMFRDLVRKLMPFRHLFLSSSRRHSIAYFLDHANELA
ncbi:unnamed protein product [Cochlearia groenlandica]